LNSTDNIEYKDSGEHSAVLKSKILNFHYFDYYLAVKFIGKLNETVNDPDIKRGITDYRNLRQSKEEKCNQFNKELDDLIRGISLYAKVLDGACDHCLNLHDPKESRQLKPLLSQIH
jgi:hypothetical protein